MPRQADPGNSRQLSFLFDVDLYEEVRKRAREEQRTVRATIERALREYLEKNAS